MQELKAKSAARNISIFVLRRNLGVLGLTLPFILVIFNYLLFNDSVIKPSISHYYYTGMSIYFTGVLWSFGLFLIAYKGHDRAKGELLSDNLLTNIGGVLAICTALVPTSTCAGEVLGCEIAINGHHNPILNTIHLGCAGIFLFIMGWMSIFKFTKGSTDLSYKFQKKVMYIVSGIIVWASIAFLIVDMFILKEPLGIRDVLIAETVALAFFGTAWLAKSEVLDNIIAKVLAFFTRSTAKDILTRKYK